MGNTSSDKAAKPVTALISGCHAVCWPQCVLTHLSLRKNIRARRPPSPAASEVMTSLLPVWRSHLHFLRRPRPLSSSLRVRAHTNGEGKQQLEQHRGFALVKWPQLSRFILAAWGQVDEACFCSSFFSFCNSVNRRPLPLPNFFSFYIPSDIFFLAHLMMQR